MTGVNVSLPLRELARLAREVFDDPEPVAKQQTSRPVRPWPGDKIVGLGPEAQKP